MPKQTSQVHQSVSPEEIVKCINCKEEIDLCIESPWFLNGNVSQGMSVAKIHNSPLCELCASELAEMEEIV